MIFLLSILLITAPASASDYGKLPDPKVELDNSLYVDDPEHRNGDFAAAYVYAYAKDYSRLRGLPLHIPFFIDLAFKVPDPKGPNLRQLKQELDQRALVFERSGGVEVTRYILKEIEKIKAKGSRQQLEMDPDLNNYFTRLMALSALAKTPIENINEDTHQMLREKLTSSQSEVQSLARFANLFFVLTALALGLTVLIRLRTR